jgi:hypothetical protein
MTSTTAPAFVHDALRWVRAERALPEYTPNQRDVIVRDSALYPAVAAGLLRDAVGFLTRAASVGREDHGPSVDTVAALAQLRAASGRAPDPEDVRRIADALEASHPLYFDSMDLEELTASQEALEREALWLRTLIDLRTPTYRAGARVGRIGGLAILGAWLLYALFHAIFPPKNLALHRPVRQSSHQPGTPDPSELVDGKIAPTFGFHTDAGQKDGWGIIELERPTAIRRIVVYNRSDNSFDDGLPMALDVSTDGVTFHEVARRTDHFGDGSFLSPPWSVNLREYGRYVRIRSKRHVALNEIEVF